MKTLLNTVLLMVLMLALIAVHKAWRDYGENEQAYRDGPRMGRGEIRIGNMSGDVTVEGWIRP